MSIKKICITGQNGFIGNHLYNTLKLFPNKYSLIEFQDNFFESDNKLKNCLLGCDVIIHLAAINRCNDPNILFETNISLTKKIINALKKINSNAHVIMSSSIQEKLNNPYGKSKKISRDLFKNWNNENLDNAFAGLLIPNVFGPFCLPNYNSFIATFCHNLLNNMTPTIIDDNQVDLIYIADLINEIINIIDKRVDNNKIILKTEYNYKVSDVLNKLIYFKECYMHERTIPNLKNPFDLKLFNTFRSYINYHEEFPRKYVINEDERGMFIELARFGISGQTSFSTTKPGIVRGNHFHTRKIERFSVIKGKALIQIRKIGTDNIIEFYLDGDSPSYVDMPVWYTHNIKNIGNDELLTNFWINEPYDPKNSDTYFVKV